MSVHPVGQNPLALAAGPHSNPRIRMSPSPRPSKRLLLPGESQWSLQQIIVVNVVLSISEAVERDMSGRAGLKISKWAILSDQSSLNRVKAFHWEIGRFRRDQGITEGCSYHNSKVEPRTPVRTAYARAPKEGVNYSCHVTPVLTRPFISLLIFPRIYLARTRSVWGERDKGMARNNANKHRNARHSPLSLCVSTRFAAPA